MSNIHPVDANLEKEENPFTSLGFLHVGTEDYMCPNCVTPWKCNGPHISEPTWEAITEAVVLDVLERIELAIVVADISEYSQKDTLQSLRDTARKIRSEYALADLDTTRQE